MAAKLQVNWQQNSFTRYLTTVNYGQTHVWPRGLTDCQSVV